MLHLKRANVNESLAFELDFLDDEPALVGRDEPRLIGFGDPWDAVAEQTIQ